MTEQVTDQMREPSVMFSVGVRLALSIRVRRVEGPVCWAASRVLGHRRFYPPRNGTICAIAAAVPGLFPRQTLISPCEMPQLDPVPGISRQPYDMKT